MKGLKKYTHRDRDKIIEEMIPMIKKKFGENLIALAAGGSFARNEDSDYSDLELVAFVKKMPKGKSWEGVGKIRDGLMVELVWQTKADYIKSTLDINDLWHISGSEKLLPIINKKYIEKINKYRVKSLRRKCLNYAAKNWYETQEATAKVLNAITQKNHDGIPLLVSDMFLRMLVVLSFLNMTPYTTLAKFASEARKLKIKPKSFDMLMDIMVQGTYGNLSELKRIVVNVFTEFERIFEECGIELYEDNIDPNIPYKTDFFKR